MLNYPKAVIAGLDPAIHAIPPRSQERMDVRVEPGHDDEHTDHFVHCSRLVQAFVG
jgi:hypothetical protein